MEQISVSVVITAYNASRWVDRTIDSILTQTYPVLEVIVVDDGSTDDTSNIIRSYGGNVKCIYQENSGQPVARNLGIRIARGKYIAFVDADDHWHPQKLEKQMDLIRLHGFAWVICDNEWVNVKDEKLDMLGLALHEGDILRILFMGNFIVSATPVIRRDVFDQVGYFNEDPKARIGEDWDMWLRIAAKYPLGVVREKLAYVQVHPQSMMSIATMEEKVTSLRGVVLRAVSREPAYLKLLEKYALANIYYQAGVQLIRQNQYHNAFIYFFHGLRHHPFRVEFLIYMIVSVLGPDISKPIISLKRSIWKS